MLRSYTEMMKYETFGDKLEYLRLLDGNVRSPKHISDRLYHHRQWSIVREQVLIRDLGKDLGVENMLETDRIIVHHINPVTEEDIESWNVNKLFNQDNLITVSGRTHNRIHYGDKPEPIAERSPNDTILW